MTTGRWRNVRIECRPVTTWRQQLGVWILKVGMRIGGWRLHVTGEPEITP
jgi:hypothetical protein